LLTASSDFDLAIIGGGPAGTAAAITAARLGAKVVLFEARDFPRHKVCGEFVSGEAVEVLARLLGNQAAADSLIANAPIIARTRLWLGSRVIESPVSPPAVSISRYELDAKLWHAAQAAGVECRSGCEVSAIAGDSPFELRAAAARVTASAVVVAAGRWSQFTVDRTIPSGPRWIGVKAHFRESNPNPSTDLYFFNHGYCGVQPVQEDIVNACAMVRSDRATSLAEVLRLHPRLAVRAANWTPMMEPVSTAPLIYRPPEPIHNNVAFVGDAAAFIDPFVGDGISIALRSGRLAAKYLGEFFSSHAGLPECIAAYRGEYDRQFAPLLIVASRARKLLSLPVAARAVGFELLRLPGLIPSLIRKTRQAG
jgi:menaquinone-9 beta-reductase